MKPLLITAVTSVALLTSGCKPQTSEKELNAIFPKGSLGPAENFTGKA
jgi:hypothetical protein